MKRRAPLHPITAALALSLAAAPARAIPFARRIALRAEGHLGLIVGGTQTAVWSAGAIARGSFALSIVEPVSLQLTVVEGIFPTRLSPGTSLNTNYLAGVRVEPRTVRPEGRIFVDVNAGLAITGYERRFGFDVGAGWELAANRYFYIGPVVRYSHIYQPDDLPGDPSDAHYLSVGVTLMLRPSPPPRTRQGTFLAINAANLPDRDYDGVPDDFDRCGEVPEDHDGYEDEDGCPDLDDDNDGLPDSEDRCPRAAETPNSFEDEDGCPDEPPPGRERIEWRDNELRLRQRVYFPTNRAAVPPMFFPILTELADFLIGHPEIRRLRIEGHSDDRGTRREGFSLSLRRAQAVAAFLVEKGVDVGRLEPVGYGDLAPLERVHDEVTRSRNRRIEFTIAQGPAGAAPAPPAGVFTPNTDPLADPPPAPR